MMQSENIQDLRIYCKCMEEIKNRINILLTFFNQKGSTGNEITDIEFGCLQFRKVLELIALASIAANKAEYAKQREKFYKDWNVNLIFKDLDRVNPNFYPVPVEQINNNKHFQEISSGFLTKQEFFRVYEKCCSTLHATNPFGDTRDFKTIRKEFQVWLDKIMTLLKIHRIQLIDSSSILLVVMEQPIDKKVHAIVAQQI